MTRHHDARGASIPGGGRIYTREGAGDFLYPPSALLLLLPLGAFGIAWAGRLFFVVNLVAVLVSTGILLSLFGLRWRGLPGAAAVFVLGLSWPVIFTLDAGNVNGLVLLGLSTFLLAATRDRWVLAGVCLGLTLALKPILAPVLIVVALYRRWDALGIALVVPAALSAPVMLAVPATRAFFDETLPMLLRGQNSEIQKASVALQSAAARLSIPDRRYAARNSAVIIATALLLWQRSRGNDVQAHDGSSR